MRIHRHLYDIPNSDKFGAVAIGNFDGVHIGHKTVIGKAGQYAKSNNLPWTVLTFEPHPRQFFSTTSKNFRLTPLRSKAQLIEDLGVDLMIILKFDTALCHCDAETFINNVLVNGVAAQHVVAGYDFHFGHKRQGDCNLLRSLGKKLGYKFTEVHAALDDDGGIYASTRVRQKLENGDPFGAKTILGHPFSISGVVMRGEKLGRKLGYPTANIALGSYIRPKFGIYAVKAYYEKKRYSSTLTGVANIGTRPTVCGKTELLEVFFFDFNADLYGQRLKVELLHFIRPEKNFPDLKSMVLQMAKDCEIGQAFFKNE